MPSCVAARNQLRDSRPAQNDLADVSAPEAGVGEVLELDGKGPVCCQGHDCADDEDQGQVAGDERRVRPFARPELDRRVHEHQVDEDPGKESDLLGHGWRVEHAVDEFPADVRAAVPFC
jgi:hypothetical protein